MTTIAYKDGIMAADSQATMGSHKFSNGMTQKVYVVGEGTGLMARAGTIDDRLMIEEHFDQIVDMETFVNWVELNSAVGIDSEWILVFNGDLNRVYIGQASPDKVETMKTQVSIIDLDDGEGIAGGSGWKYAIGAMRAGASAGQAVAIASEFCTQTGGEVVEYSFDE